MWVLGASARLEPRPSLCPRGPASSDQQAPLPQTLSQQNPRPLRGSGDFGTGDRNQQRVLAGAMAYMRDGRGPPGPGGKRLPDMALLLGGAFARPFPPAAVFSLLLGFPTTRMLCRPRHRAGDNAYSVGSHSEYRRNFFRPYRHVLPHLPLWPVIGNHDTYRRERGPPHRSAAASADAAR